MRKTHLLLCAASMLLWAGCEELPEKKLYGVWVISEFNTNGFDQTNLVNEGFEHWLELKENNKFRSGSMKIEHHGQWFYDEKKQIIQFESEPRAWGNTKWEVKAHSQNLYLKQVDNMPIPLTGILFRKTEKIPTITKYVRTELDLLTGLWQVDSLKANGKITDELHYKWIRLRRIGIMESGDQNGFLFQTKFNYIDSTNTLITLSSSGTRDRWQLDWNQDHSQLTFITSGTDSKMYLSRIREFAD